MFELADMWTENIGPDEYAIFLNDLFACVVDEVTPIFLSTHPMLPSLQPRFHSQLMSPSTWCCFTLIDLLCYSLLLTDYLLLQSGDGKPAAWRRDSDIVFGGFELPEMGNEVSPFQAACRDWRRLVSDVQHLSARVCLGLWRGG